MITTDTPKPAVRHTSPPMLAFIRLVRAHAAITRQLSADLLGTHGLTLNDFEVLLHLSLADERKLRRVDLAERVLLTASGITRLLDGLERAGYVEKGYCRTDARVTYAILTDAGLEKLRAAAPEHIESVEALLSASFEEAEIVQLAELLARIPGVDPDAASCAPE